MADPVIVSALVDLDRRSCAPRARRVRGVAELLTLAPEVLRVPLPMVVFTEADLVERLAACRQSLAPGLATVIVPYVPHPEWDDDVASLARSLEAERPLCASNVVKDTPEFLAFGWSKPHCLRLASQLADADWYWWIDIGIAHASAVPADLDERLRALSVTDGTTPHGTAAPGPGGSPIVQFVSLECEGWHAQRGNVALTRRLAASAERMWWFSGAQLVAGGVIGVSAGAVDTLIDRTRQAAADATVHQAAVTEEMLFTRALVQHPDEVAVHPGGFGDLFGALEPATRPRLQDLCPSTRFVRLPAPERPDRAAFNPSIAVDPDGGLRVIVRHANYRYVSGDYQPLDGSELIITDNVLISLDDDLVVRWSVPIDDSRARVNPPRYPVHGLEDMRLFRHGARWWVSATSREHRSDGLCQIVVAELGDRRDPGRIMSSFRLPSLRVGRHEKNWVPIAAESIDPHAPMRFLWSVVPPRVVTVDDVLGAITLDRALAPELDPVPVRGGSQLVPVWGGWLTVAHRVVAARGDLRRVYEHLIVWFDADFGVLGCSPWFVFAVEGVEFCAGLAACGSGVVLSFGVDDREAWLAHVSWEELRFMVGTHEV